MAEVRKALEGTSKVVIREEYQCTEIKYLSKGDDLCEIRVVPRTAG